MTGNLKPIFFTSDWHLGHEKCLEYDQRPFYSIDHMAETLIKRYNSTVPINGVCYFLGDMGNRTEDIRSVITKLNGIKVLILGNHDKGVTTMYNCGFDVVMFSSCIYISDHRITMSHCPLLGTFREDTSDMRNSELKENWHGESREKYRRHSLKNEGQFHLHGHIHSRKEKTVSTKISGKQFDVGVTANNYTPVSLSQIESWVMTYGK